MDTFPKVLGVQAYVPRGICARVEMWGWFVNVWKWEVSVRADGHLPRVFPTPGIYIREEETAGRCWLYHGAHLLGLCPVMTWQPKLFPFVYGNGHLFRMNTRFSDGLKNWKASFVVLNSESYRWIYFRRDLWRSFSPASYPEHRSFQSHINWLCNCLVCVLDIVPVTGLFITFCKISCCLFAGLISVESPVLVNKTHPIVIPGLPQSPEVICLVFLKAVVTHQVL